MHMPGGLTFALIDAGQVPTCRELIVDHAILIVLQRQSPVPSNDPRMDAACNTLQGSWSGLQAWDINPPRPSG